jgi:FkbM family methyltransferase
MTDCGPIEIWGSDLGRRLVPVEFITPSMLCYCAGVGEDTTFDEKLLKAGHTVFAFDPTPRALRHVSKSGLLANPRFTFLPIGIFSGDTVLQLNVPADPNDESCSILPIISNGQFVEAQCKSIGQIMRERNHAVPDLVKLDIEGSEHEALRAMLHDRILPRILMVEFDQPASPWKVIKSVSRLRACGYVLVAIDGLNYTFVLPKPR